MQHTNVPQWMKEVLERGYKPAKIYTDLQGALFGYVDARGNELVKVDRKRLYVLEGLPGAGKTSTVNALAAHNTLINTIPQILPDEPNFDQDMTQEFFLRSDELKTERFLAATSDTSVADRYYASTLAFYWAYDKVHNTNSYDTVFCWYTFAKKHGKLVTPYAVFYIDVTPDISLARKGRTASESTEDLWLNIEFLKYFRSYYDYFYTHVEPGTRLVKLSGLNLLEDIQDEIKGRISHEN